MVTMTTALLFGHFQKLKLFSNIPDFQKLPFPFPYAIYLTKIIMKAARDLHCLLSKAMYEASISRFTPHFRSKQKQIEITTEHRLKRSFKTIKTVLYNYTDYVSKSFIALTHI